MSSQSPGGTSFRDDTREVSQVIGAVFIFGILVVAFSGYQAFVIPNQNAETEFNHYGDVKDDMT